MFIESVWENIVCGPGGEWLVVGKKANCWQLLAGVKFEMHHGECMAKHGFYSLTSAVQ
jgi:hypothetical protein